MLKDFDKRFMKEALRLAAMVKGLTSPDPAVGAVIVKNGKIVGRGYHDRFTTPHAETFAIKKAGPKAKGSTLYVTLEPCCHHGNNPPCTDNIIKSGIKRVVAAMKDPNPLVCGKGFAALKRAGVEVEIGLMQEEAKSMNEAFIKYITAKMPHVTLKMAMSLDGKTATRTGDSKWISSKESRDIVQDLRCASDAIMVGVNTIIKDDPQLVCRKRINGTKKKPIRIVADPLGATPPKAKILSDGKAPTIIVVTKHAAKENIRRLEKTGAQVLLVKGSSTKIDLKSLMKELAKRKCSSILVEGGSELAAGAIEQNIVDKIVIFIAPKIIGGAAAKPVIGGGGIKNISDAVKLVKMKFRKVGGDLMIEAGIERI